MQNVLTFIAKRHYDSCSEKMNMKQKQQAMNIIQVRGGGDMDLNLMEEVMRKVKL